MNIVKLYKVFLFVLVGFASFLPLATIVLGYHGSGGGP